jgi:diacylglycerol kinase (ATP)
MRERVAELGIAAEIIETSSQEEMCSVIRRLQAEGAPRIGVSGGDGTIHEAVQCLACSDTELLILPQGTRNNFAHALQLPMDLDEALQLISSERVVQVDLGKVGHTFFTEAAGVGLFADALQAYGNANKNFWRGLYAIYRIFFSLRSKRLRLTLDGQVISERAVMCTVANGYRIGAGVPVAPNASVTDGLLDVVIFGDLTRFELLPYHWALKHERHLTLPKVSQIQARTILIETGLPQSVHSDDHVVGTTPVTVVAAPRALKVVVPN